jgi:hypothetical protein
VRSKIASALLVDAALAGGGRRSTSTNLNGSGRVAAALRRQVEAVELAMELAIPQVEAAIANSEGLKAFVSGVQVPGHRRQGTDVAKIVI